MEKVVIFYLHAIYLVLLFRLCWFHAIFSLFQLNASVPKYITFKRRTVRIDPTLCPHNNELVAYVEDNDLWVKNIVSGDEKRLTYAHKGNKL